MWRKIQKKKKFKMSKEKLVNKIGKNVKITCCWKTEQLCKNNDYGWNYKVIISVIIDYGILLDDKKNTEK